MERRSARPINLPSMHAELQNRIKEYILNNKLQPGDALPTEAQLAEQIGVSRSATREALRSLEALGIIHTRRGEGRYVSDFSLDPVLASLNYSLLFDESDLQQMIDVRERLELSYIEDAIANMDQETLEHLRSLCNDISQKASSDGYFLDKDLDFHCTIYRSTGNLVLCKLLDVFGDIYMNLRDKSLPVPRDPVAEARIHIAIFQAIESRDPVLARRLIAEHFRAIKDRIQAARERRSV